MFKSFFTPHTPTPPCHLPGEPCPGPSLEPAASPGRTFPSPDHAPTAPLHHHRSQVGSSAAIPPTPTSAVSNCLASSLPSRAIWTSSDLVPRGMEEGQQHLGVVSREESYGLEAGGLWAYMKRSRLPRAPLCLPSPLGMAWTPNGCCIS